MTVISFMNAQRQPSYPIEKIRVLYPAARINTLGKGKTSWSHSRRASGWVQRRPNPIVGLEPDVDKPVILVARIPSTLIALGLSVRVTERISMRSAVGCALGHHRSCGRDEAHTWPNFIRYYSDAL